MAVQQTAAGGQYGYAAATPAAQSAPMQQSGQAMQTQQLMASLQQSPAQLLAGMQMQGMPMGQQQMMTSTLNTLPQGYSSQAAGISAGYVLPQGMQGMQMPYTGLQ